LTTPNKHCTVRIDRGKYDRLVALASERGCTPSDLIRTAIDNFLSREQFPEYRDRIIAETDKRLELYHGA